MLKRSPLVLAGFAALVGLVVVSPVAAQAPPQGPAYQIVLRSRTAEVTPHRTKDAQTGGGSIIVEQPEANTIVITMGGAAVVGSDCREDRLQPGTGFGNQPDPQRGATAADRPGRAGGRNAPGD
jgi:hypothetical protein